MIRLYIEASEFLTQKGVAKACGVSESTLSRFLSGEQMPDAPSFIRILAWCHAHPEPIERPSGDPFLTGSRRRGRTPRSGKSAPTKTSG
jgi:transcriptional regulator with XRE-family HTH domain